MVSLERLSSAHISLCLNVLNVPLWWVFPLQMEIKIQLKWQLFQYLSVAYCTQDNLRQNQQFCRGFWNEGRHQKRYISIDTKRLLFFKHISWKGPIDLLLFVLLIGIKNGVYFYLFTEQLLRRTSISPVPQGPPAALIKVKVDTNGIAQVTQGVSMVSTTDTTEGTTQAIKMEPQASEQIQNEVATVTSEKEKHPMHAMTSVMKNTAKGMNVLC